MAYWDTIIHMTNKISKDTQEKLGYISLFSGAGIGTYGFKLENYECIVTSELLGKRLEIQKYNNVCHGPDSYISGDIRDPEVSKSILLKASAWEQTSKRNVDLIIATPPCQGMSVANHKKNNENSRNSLVVESIKIINTLKPSIFIFENVRSFLKTECTGIDGNNRTILDEINNILGPEYTIESRIINFVDYGSNSSRTRTLVIGTAKSNSSIAPDVLFPRRKKTRTVKELIGHLPKLKKMSQVTKNDILHSFKSYNVLMLPWVKNTKPGKSAFGNLKPEQRPHSIVNGIYTPHTNKNSDKYKRIPYDKIAPCIHTRNDILSSQSTVHPTDNRVLSIRELMILMNIPSSFKWFKESYKLINALSESEKIALLRKNENNIRQCIGEAVPTAIFRQIAVNINKFYNPNPITVQGAKKIIIDYDLDSVDSLLTYFKNSEPTIPEMLLIAEHFNAKRTSNAAYYTNLQNVYEIVSKLSAGTKKDEICILEPAVGAGAFIINLIPKFYNFKKVVIDVVDIDKESIKVFNFIIKSMGIPDNININSIVSDFFDYQIKKKYDYIIANPPYGKVTKNSFFVVNNQKETIEYKDLYQAFLYKCLQHKPANIIFLIPKTFLISKDSRRLRDIVKPFGLEYVIDFGQTAFIDVKIETICISICLTKKSTSTIVASKIFQSTTFLDQMYIQDPVYPGWLIYRNDNFDKLALEIDFGVFDYARDRKLTKSVMGTKGNFRVITSKNVHPGSLMLYDDDSWVDSLEVSSVDLKKYPKNSYALVPNLSYFPRACKIDDEYAVSGSVAVIYPKKKKKLLTKKVINFFDSYEFFMLYRVAVNYSVRSLNIDSYTIFFWGIPNDSLKLTAKTRDEKRRLLNSVM